MSFIFECSDSECTYPDIMLIQTEIMLNAPSRLNTEEALNQNSTDTQNSSVVICREWGFHVSDLLCLKCRGPEEPDQHNI